MLDPIIISYKLTTTVSVTYERILKIPLNTTYTTFTVFKSYKDLKEGVQDYSIEFSGKFGEK